MKKVFSVSLIIMLMFSMIGTTAMAAENIEHDYNSVKISTENIDEYIVAGICPTSKEEHTLDAEALTIDIEYLFEHSTNVTRSGSEYSGSFSSPKYSAGLAGYEYNINFEWEAAVDSDSNYYFKDFDIIDPHITTYYNYLILGLTWSYYSYDIIKNSYDVSNDGYSVTFFTNYRFTVIPKDGFITQTFTQNNTQTITLEELL